MSELVAAVVPGRSEGEYVLDLLHVEQEYGRFYYQDAALAYKEDDEVKLHQTTVLTKKKGGRRGFWIGLGVGFLLGGPIGGALLGTGAGVLIGKKDRGLSDEMMESLNLGLDQGYAVVFVQCEGANAMSAQQFLEGHSEQVFVETIDDETAANLQQAYDDTHDA